MVELIWDGKYDASGKRTAPLRVALPFQTVETVNESAQQRQKSLFSLLQGGQSEWRNRLIWGDKKYVLPSLLPEFAGKVDLIYIDPPFATGADFSFQAQVGDETFEKTPSIVEQKECHCLRAPTHRFRGREDLPLRSDHPERIRH